MHRMVLALVASCAAAIMVGCSAGISVNSDYDKAYDFSKLKTFKVQLGPANSAAIAGVSPLTAQRVGKAIEAELTAKGYKKAGDDADFVAVAHGGTQEKVSEGSWGYEGYWDGPVDSFVYTEGALVIDMVDLKTNRAIWRGVGKEIIGDEEPTEGKIDEAVGTVLNNFPPGINTGAK
jgi:hypothetical protein